MAGGFGALVGDAALPSATRPTDVPRADVGQVDAWHADVWDVDDVRHGWCPGRQSRCCRARLAFRGHVRGRTAADALADGPACWAQSRYAISTARPCRPTSRSPTCPDHPAFAKYRSLPPGVGVLLGRWL